MRVFEEPSSQLQFIHRLARASDLNWTRTSSRATPCPVAPGHIIVNGGTLTRIDNVSGHYAPNAEALRPCLHHVSGRLLP